MAPVSNRCRSRAWSGSDTTFDVSPTLVSGAPEPRAPARATRFIAATVKNLQGARLENASAQRHRFKIVSVRIEEAPNSNLERRVEIPVAVEWALRCRNQYRVMHFEFTVFTFSRELVNASTH